MAFFPKDTGEGGCNALAHFLHEMLTHLQRRHLGRPTEPDLAAYTRVFGVTDLVRIQSIMARLLRGDSVSEDQIIEAIYLMRQADAQTSQVFDDPNSVFGFDRGLAPNGKRDILVWKSKAGKFLKAKDVYAVARRYRRDKSQVSRDELDLLASVVAGFRELHLKKEKLIIQPVPEINEEG